MSDQVCLNESDTTKWESEKGHLHLFNTKVGTHQPMRITGASKTVLLVAQLAFVSIISSPSSTFSVSLGHHKKEASKDSNCNSYCTHITANEQVLSWDSKTLQFMHTNKS